MSELSKKQPKASKKLLENPVVGSMVVPIAIVLVGALIIFGVTKLLSSERSYKDLVREMQSKTFGNRWIAAYELSKVIATKQVPPEDIPWLVENLSSIYNSSTAPQTREFVITALGALNSPLSLSTISKALSDREPKVQFQALIALANQREVAKDFNWSIPINYLEGEDLGLTQVAILTLSTHRVTQAQEKIAQFLNHQKETLRFSSAIGLINFKDLRAQGVLKELLLRNYPQDSSNEEVAITKVELESLKINLLSSMERNNWNLFEETLQQVSNQDKSVKVAAKARSLLKTLKN